MKRYLFLLTAIGSFCLHADESIRFEQTLELTTEEIAFIAKLEDQNRKTFVAQLSPDQRQAAMVAAKNGANPNDAVYRMHAAQEIKEKKAVALQ